MHVRVRLLLPAAALYASVALNAAPASAPVGCDQFLPPPRDVKGAKIGPQLVPDAARARSTLDGGARSRASISASMEPSTATSRKSATTRST